MLGGDKYLLTHWLACENMSLQIESQIYVYLCAFSMFDGMFSPRNSSLIALLIFNVPPMFLVHQCIYLVSLLLRFLNWMSMPKIYLNPQMYLNSRMAQNKARWNIFFISKYSGLLCTTGRDFETIVAVFLNIFAKDRICSILY